ncbi:unnamed protein product [Neospora caninum Liverpool]|nr:uncharacterized protein NCLIV_066800 [Neospora caninum Liverpool]CBZ56255.1 unnamed protein product [Neospora caninum Liverpool]|eukprot:XP_003886280.1 uncharacterized protein NCLIV_066800 [Neospora caninum Liverpool]
MVSVQTPKSPERSLPAFAVNKEGFIPHHNHVPASEDAAGGGEAFAWTHRGPMYPCGQTWPNGGVPGMGDGARKVGVNQPGFTSHYPGGEQAAGRRLDDSYGCNPREVQAPSGLRQETERSFPHQQLPPGAVGNATDTAPRGAAGSPQTMHGRMSHCGASMAPANVYYESAPYTSPEMNFGSSFSPSFSTPATYTQCSAVQSVQSQQCFPAPYSFPVAADAYCPASSSFPSLSFSRSQDPAASSPASPQPGPPQETQLPSDASSPKQAANSGARSRPRSERPRQPRRKSPKGPRRSPQTSRAPKNGSSSSSGGTTRPVRGLPLQQRKLYRHFARQTPRVQGLTFDHNQIRWISYWKNDQGRQIQRHFPVSRHGFLEARRLALEERNRILGWPPHTDEAAEAIEALKAAADPFVQQLLVCPPSMSASASVAASLSDAVCPRLDTGGFSACALADGERPPDREASTAWAEEEEKPLRRGKETQAEEGAEATDRGCGDASDDEGEADGPQPVLGSEDTEREDTAKLRSGTEQEPGSLRRHPAWCAGVSAEAPDEGERCGEARTLEDVNVASGLHRAEKSEECLLQKSPETARKSGETHGPIASASSTFTHSSALEGPPLSAPGCRVSAPATPERNTSSLADSTFPRGFPTPDRSQAGSSTPSSAGGRPVAAPSLHPASGYSPLSDPASSSLGSRPGLTSAASSFSSSDFSAGARLGPDAEPPTAKAKAPRRSASRPAARKHGEGARKSSGSRRRKAKAAEVALSPSAGSGLPPSYSIPPSTPGSFPVSPGFSAAETGGFEDGSRASLSPEPPRSEPYASLSGGEPSGPCLPSLPARPRCHAATPPAQPPHNLPFAPLSAPEGASRPAAHGPAHRPGSGAAPPLSPRAELPRVQGSPSPPGFDCSSPYPSVYPPAFSSPFPAHQLDFNDPFTMFGESPGLYWEQLQLQQLEQQAEVLAGKAMSRKRKRRDSKSAGRPSRAARGPQPAKPRERKKGANRSGAGEKDKALANAEAAASEAQQCPSDSAEGAAASDEETLCRSAFPFSRSPSEVELQRPGDADQASPSRTTPPSPLPAAPEREAFHLPHSAASTARAASLPFLSVPTSDRFVREEEKAFRRTPDSAPSGETPLFYADVETAAASSGGVAATSDTTGFQDSGESKALASRLSGEDRANWSERFAHLSAALGEKSNGTPAYARKGLPSFEPSALSPGCALPDSAAMPPFFCSAGQALTGSRAATTAPEAPFLPTTTADGCSAQLACPFGAKTGHAFKRRNSALFSLSRSSTNFELVPTPAEAREEARAWRGEQEEGKATGLHEGPKEAAGTEKAFPDWLAAGDEGPTGAARRRQGAFEAPDEGRDGTGELGASVAGGHPGEFERDRPRGLATSLLPTGVNASLLRVPTLQRTDTTTTEDAHSALSFLPSLPPLLFQDVSLSPRNASPPPDALSQTGENRPRSALAPPAELAALDPAATSRLPDAAKHDAKAWAHEPFFSPLISFSSCSGAKLRRTISTDGCVPCGADRLDANTALSRVPFPDGEEDKRRERRRNQRRRSGTMSLARRSSWASAAGWSPRLHCDSLSPVVAPAAKSSLFLPPREGRSEGKEVSVGSREDTLSSSFPGAKHETLDSAPAADLLGLPALRPQLSLLSPRRLSYAGDSPFEFFTPAHPPTYKAPPQHRSPSAPAINKPRLSSSLASLPALSSLSSSLSSLSTSLCCASSSALSTHPGMTRLISLGDARTVSTVSTAGLMEDSGRRDTAFLTREETGELSAFEEPLEKPFLDVSDSGFALHPSLRPPTAEPPHTGENSPASAALPAFAFASSLVSPESPFAPAGTSLESPALPSLVLPAAPRLARTSVLSASGSDVLSPSRALAHLPFLDLALDKADGRRNSAAMPFLSSLLSPSHERLFPRLSAASACNAPFPPLSPRLASKRRRSSNLAVFCLPAEPCLSPCPPF